MAPYQTTQTATEPPRRPTWEPGEREAAVSQLVAGALVAYLVYRFVRRLSWDRPFRLRFVLLHLAAAPAAGMLWLGLSIIVETLVTGSPEGNRSSRRVAVAEIPMFGVFLYAVIATVAHSMERRARAADLRAQAARAQLAALRAQLHPHFLFNALHTVVHLIPVDPARAADAAELVASLLRRSVEEERDEVTLDEEWTFVARYLEVERIRFGERLRVHAKIRREHLDERIPTFALQTLVENAVRHGAAHRVAPTEIVVAAAVTDAELTLSVRNSGDPRSPGSPPDGTGTGLSRLRERLALIHGDAARLTWGALAEGGFEAVLVVPRGRRGA